MIRGSLDSVDTNSVRGWAYDPEHPASHLHVEILLDDTKVGEADASGHRGDLARAKIGAGDHGFVANLSCPLSRDDVHRVRAVAIVSPETRCELPRAPALEASTAAAELDEAWQCVLQSKAFDEVWYAEQLGHHFDRGDAVRDYLMHGEAQGRSPHPLFAPAFVEQQLHAHGIGLSKGRILSTYLTTSTIDADPHPLFDCRIFRRLTVAPTAPGTCLEHYLKDSPATTVSPNVLFDAAFYLDRNRDVRLKQIDPLLHYVSAGWREGRQPHPLFDPAHFRAALRRIGLAMPAADPLEFYYRTTEAWSVSPHPLFDPACYLVRLAQQGIPVLPGYPPLAMLLLQDNDIAPINLFDPGYYRQQAARRAIPVEEPAILHYVKHNVRHQLDPHPLFSIAFYKKKYADIAKSRMDPLVHFMQFGRSERRDPNPLFSTTDFLAGEDAGLRESVDPISEYLDADGGKLRDTHRLFEAPMYAARTPACIATRQLPLEHYMRSWAASDIWFPPWGTALTPRRGQHAAREPFDVIFVSHELTRTGAPLILLRIIRDLAVRRGIRALTIAVNGGALLDDFCEWSPVIELSAVRAAGISDIAFVAAMLEAFGRSAKPRLAFVNTVCADHVVGGFTKAAIPVTTLVHELAMAFEPRVFANIYAGSALVVYPAEFVRDEAHSRFPLPLERTAIAPQGLLEPEFGGIDAAQAREQVLAELSLPANSFVVLGCGTLDLRKGVDVFVKVALSVARLQQHDRDARPVHFVWLGDGPTSRNSSFWFAREDAERGGVIDLVHFVGARPDPEPHFVACDAFILTSRQDPFPCVVHEAMACAKPVIAFANAGGAPEALVEGAGIVVAYGDVEAMARVIVDLAGDPERCRGYGERALATVRKQYVFTEYVDRLVGLVAERMDVDLGPAVARRATIASRKRVIFAAPDWPLSDSTEFVAGLINGLNERGFDAELLFTQRDIANNGPARWPEVPTAFLPPTFREKLGYAEIWRRLTSLLERAAPAIFVADLDEVAAALTPVVPRRVGVLGVVADGSPGDDERVQRLGYYWQRAVVTSEAALLRLQALSPGLAERTEIIPFGIAAGDPPELRTGATLAVLCPIEGMTDARQVARMRRLLDRLVRPDRPCTFTILAERPTLQIMQAVLGSQLANGMIQLADMAICRADPQRLLQYDVLLRMPGVAIGPLLLLHAMNAGLIAIDVADAGLVHDRLNLLASNTDLRNHLRHAAFDTIHANGCDLRRVHDSYADMLDRMLFDLRSGIFATPRPLFDHPELGGLSLPPSLLFHPDRNRGVTKPP